MTVKLLSVQGGRRASAVFGCTLEQSNTVLHCGCVVFSLHRKTARWMKVCAFVIEICFSPRHDTPPDARTCPSFFAEGFSFASSLGIKMYSLVYLLEAKKKTKSFNSTFGQCCVIFKRRQTKKQHPQKTKVQFLFYFLYFAYVGSESNSSHECKHWEVNRLTQKQKYI